MKTLDDIEAEARLLSTAMAECQRLDEAAGEARPRLNAGEWIARRMRDAATRALTPTKELRDE